ncbi:MAG: hypothetical protein ABI625_12230 [bacterium]
MVTRLDLLLKEYDTLRTESLSSITHRTQIVAFALAAIAPRYRPLSIAQKGKIMIRKPPSAQS